MNKYRNGVYSEAEQNMLEIWKSNAQRLSGWLNETPTREIPYPVWHREATPEMIRQDAYAADYKNPLYRDEQYARQTRWGGIIAPPFFLFNIAAGGTANFLTPLIIPEIGRLISLPVFGEGFEFCAPIRPGDKFTAWQRVSSVKDITSDEDYRVFETWDQIDFYNQRSELVGYFYRKLHYVITDYDRPFQGVIPMGFDSPDRMRGMDEPRYTPSFHYSKELLDAVDRVYDNEPRRADEVRWWEDVQVGDMVPAVIMGPITAWDTVIVLRTFGCAPLPMMEIRRQTPERVILDPETGIPHKSIELHLSDLVPKLLGHYSPTLIQNSIFNFFGRMASNWMGDDGFITHHDWRKLGNTAFGDTVIGRGKVVRKYVEDGKCKVDLRLSMENLRGYINNLGATTVSLLSRTQMETGKLPDVPPQAALNLNPAGLAAGDRFRVKERPDWEFPGGYPLAGKTGRVTALHPDQPGFCYVVFDGDYTGVDPRIELGFDMLNLEKI